MKIKERLEEIVEKIAEQLYDRIVVHETKVIIEYQDIKYLFNTIEEQSRQNKRYREAIIEALHGLKTLPSVAPRLYLISILDKALEGEE